MQKLADVSKIEALYSGWEESMIWSYFQRVMGEAYVDDIINPKAAIIYVNCFAFAAGQVDENLLQEWYDQVVDGFSIITARDEAWNLAFERLFQPKCRRVQRYAIKKEKDVFDVAHLEKLVQGLDKAYSLKLIDETLYHECKKYDWSRDFVHGYQDYEMYQKYGLGVVAFHNDEMVAGASSYSSYQDGIEIEIDTKEDYRRKGLATVCGAKLILECLKRGWYPSWDAQNTWSVSLAEKLGYQYSHTYTAYEVWK